MIIALAVLLWVMVVLTSGLLFGWLCFLIAEYLDSPERAARIHARQVAAEHLRLVQSYA